MANPHLLVFSYLLCINTATFLVFGFDKQKARRSAWRISEKILILLTLFGGSAGAWFGMRFWHHKTKHPLFAYGVPIILVIHLLALLFLHGRGFTD